MRRVSISLIATTLLLLCICISSVTSVHAQSPGGDGTNVSHPCYGWPTLSYGSTGSYVSFLQSRLNTDYQAGWFRNSPYNFHPLLAVDGIFGPLTENAVKDIQTRYHVTVDGIVGPITWSLVNPGCGVG